MASAAALDIDTGIPIVRIAASEDAADPANNVISPIRGDRASCLAYISGGEHSLPESFDAERGIEKFSSGYYKRLARTLTHLKAMVAAYRLNAPAVLILDEQENPVKHPDFAWRSSLDDFVGNLKPGWQHVQLSVVAMSDSFGVLVQDWNAAGRPDALPISARDRARPNTELWSYGAYLVSKAGLANTLLAYSNRQKSESGPKTLKFDLSSASCIEPDNCLLWEGVRGQGWYVATPPLLAAGAQVTYDEADATDVEVAVSELIKENMYHVKRWWERPEELLYDARGGSLRLPSDDKLAAMMQEAGVQAVTPSAPRRSYASQSSSKSTHASKYDQTEALDASEFEVESPSISKSRSRSSKRGGSSPSSSTTDDTRTHDDEREAMPSDDTYDEPYAPKSYSTAASDAEPEESGGITPAEVAAQQAAGIIRTQSAFEYGKTLWTQAWGMAAQNVPVAPAEPAPIDPYVAAVGVDGYPNPGYPDQQYPAEQPAQQQYPTAQQQYPATQQYPAAQPQYPAAQQQYPASQRYASREDPRYPEPARGGYPQQQPATTQDEVADLLEQYKDEPRLGDARALGVRRGWERAAAALGAYRREREQFEAATLGAGVGGAGRGSGVRPGVTVGAGAGAAAAAVAVAVAAAVGVARGRRNGALAANSEEQTALLASETMV